MDTQSQNTENAAKPPASIDVPATLAAQRGSARLWLGVLLLCTTAISFYDLSGGARFEPIDCWVAQTAREMFEAHDWLVPRFSGEVRMQKSPGPYWAVMTTADVLGQPVNELTARIPNALAAILLVATVFWLTRHIAGPRAAVFAGFATAASPLILWWSHRAASDLGLAALSTLSLAAIWVGSEATPPGKKRVALWLLGYFSAGLAMLYKMPMPLVTVGLPAVCYVVIFRRWKILASPWHLLGLALFAASLLAWVVPVLSVLETAALAKWKVEFVDRFTGDLPNVEGQDSLKFMLTYVWASLLYCLPFSVSLPGALVRGVRRTEGVRRDGAAFALIWWASLLAFFTAATGKEERYFLPALPPLFVLLGIELAAFFDPQRPRRKQVVRGCVIGIWMLIPTAMILAGVVGVRLWWKYRGKYELQGLLPSAPTVLYSAGDVRLGYVVTAVLLGGGLALAAWLYLRNKTNGSFAAIVVTIWATWLWVWPVVMPQMLSQQPFIDFAQQVHEKVPAELMPYIAHVGSQDPRINWYGDLRWPRLIDQLQLLKEQREQGFGGRDLKYELRRYGQEMVARLAQPEPALFVATLPDYVRFLSEAPEELQKRGRALPPLYLWLQTRYGREDRHFVLFGNIAPPYREPELYVTDDVRQKIAENGGRTAWPTVAPTTESAPAQRGEAG